MIVVADASPLNYLIQLDCESVLPQLYQKVLVPEAVILELRHRKAPAPVAVWAASPPAWVEICIVTDQADGRLLLLDAGERAAIQVAARTAGSVLLIDESKGREEAVRRGISTTGTLGILLAAAKRGLVDGGEVFNRLLTGTSFRASAQLRLEFAGQFAKLQTPRPKKDSLE